MNEELPKQEAKQETDDRQWYKDSYQSFSRTLRTWLVGFGIGAPVLFVSQASFAKILTNHELAKPIIFLFLFGLLVQVLGALLYKAAMWYIMWGSDPLNVKFQSTCRYKASDWVSEQLWLEIAFDVVSIIAFASATYRTLMAYLEA